MLGWRRRGEGRGFPSDAVAGPVHLVGAAVQQQPLAGDQVPARVDRQVDDAHPTAPESALHLVVHGPTSLRAGGTPRPRVRPVKNFRK